MNKTLNDFKEFIFKYLIYQIIYYNKSLIFFEIKENVILYPYIYLFHCSIYYFERFKNLIPGLRHI